MKVSLVVCSLSALASAFPKGHDSHEDTLVVNAMMGLGGATAIIGHDSKKGSKYKKGKYGKYANTVVVPLIPTVTSGPVPVPEPPKIQPKPFPTDDCTTDAPVPTPTPVEDPFSDSLPASDTEPEIETEPDSEFIAPIYSSAMSVESLSALTSFVLAIGMFF